MATEKHTTLACFGAIVLVIFAGVGGVITQGLVVSVLWRWFIVPAFEAPALTIVQAYGVALVFAALRGYVPPQKASVEDTTTEAVTKVIMIVILHPSMLLLLGWIIKGLL